MVRYGVDAKATPARSTRGVEPWLAPLAWPHARASVVRFGRGALDLQIQRDRLEPHGAVSYWGQAKATPTSMVCWG